MLIIHGKEALLHTMTLYIPLYTSYMGLVDNKYNVPCLFIPLLFVGIQLLLQ